MDHEDFTSQGAVSKLIEYNLNKDFIKLKLPYLNHLFQLQASLNFIESIINRKTFAITPKIESANQIIFESSPKGFSKY